MSVMLLPKLLTLVFVVIIIWIAWKVILAIATPKKDEIDYDNEEVEEKIEDIERKHTLAGKVSSFKEKGINPDEDNKTIQSFTQNKEE